MNIETEIEKFKKEYCYHRLIFKHGEMCQKMSANCEWILDIRVDVDRDNIHNIINELKELKHECFYPPGVVIGIKPIYFECDYYPIKSIIRVSVGYYRDDVDLTYLGFINIKRGSY